MSAAIAFVDRLIFINAGILRAAPKPALLVPPVHRATDDDHRATDEAVGVPSSPVPLHDSD